jgi:hypothetical protein
MSEISMKRVMDEAYAMVVQFAAGPWPVDPLLLFNALKGHDSDRFYQAFTDGEALRKAKVQGTDI